MRRARAMLFPVIALLTSDGRPASAGTVGCSSQLCQLVDGGPPLGLALVQFCGLPTANPKLLRTFRIFVCVDHSDRSDTFAERKATGTDVSEIIAVSRMTRARFRNETPVSPDGNTQDRNSIAPL